jgi:hypothetical protein
MQNPARTAAAVLLMSLSLAGNAAASDICDRLGFALANLSERAVPTDEVRKYGRAIVEQKRSLRELGRTMRRDGCSNGSVMVVGGANADECSHLEAKQARMERNLEILEAKKISLLSDNSSGLQRRRLVAALEQNRCNEQPQLVSTPGNDDSASLVSKDAGGLETIRVPSSEPNYSDSQFVDLGGAAINGNYRTMCVRACDGAYFPVSSHASPMNFRRDAQVCSMMCPGTETELYFHSIQTESAAMRSTRTGRPYDEMQNAYRFRTQKPGSKAECGCNFALYYKEMMKRQSYVANPASIPEKQSAIVWLKPELRGGLKKTTEAVAEKKPQERDYVPDGHVRIIGPQFLPDKGIDFTSPATVE